MIVTGAGGEKEGRRERKEEVGDSVELGRV